MVGFESRNRGQPVASVIARADPRCPPGRGPGARQSHSCDHETGTEKNMEERRRLAPSRVWGATLAILLTGAAGVARAQAADTPPPAAPAAPPAAPMAIPPPPP